MKTAAVWILTLLVLLVAGPVQARQLSPMERALLAIQAKPGTLGNTPTAAGQTWRAPVPGQTAAAPGAVAENAAAVAVTPTADPLHLIVNPGADSIALSWSNTATAWHGFAGYVVCKGEGQEVLQPAHATPMAETRYLDLTVTAETDYTYQVLAMDAQGATLGASSVASGRLQPVIPPGGIKDLAVESEEERVTLKWMKADQGSRPVAGYQIYRSTSLNETGTPLTVTPWAKNDYHDDLGVPNQEYYYTVVPVDAKGVTGPASAPLPGHAKPRNRSSLVWASTAYPGHGRAIPDLTGDLQFTYYIGTLYGQDRVDETATSEAPNLTYLDPISLWLLSADVKYSFLSERQAPVAMAAGAKAGLQLFAGQQSSSSASFTFSSKSQLNYLWGGYLALSRSFGNVGVHAGYMQGTFSDPIFYLSKYMESESQRSMVYLGTEFPITRRMNTALEILYPVASGSSRHPFLVNLHVDRLLNFDIAYLHWDEGWAFLGYFNIRFTVYPGS